MVPPAAIVAPTRAKSHCDAMEQEQRGQTTMDPEAQERGGRRRGRGCLDAFLVTSVILLFVAVTAVGAGGLVAVMDLRSRVGAPPTPTFQPFQGTRKMNETPSPAYKMQNFAFLEATDSNLSNYTMSWSPVNHGQGNSVGSNFKFSETQMLLKPTREGTYFMYLDLALSCTASACKPGVVTVKLDKMLTCSVELRAGELHASKKCWSVVKMDGEKGLVAVMTAPKEVEDWKLELNQSHLGMFLVD